MTDHPRARLDDRRRGRGADRRPPAARTQLSLETIVDEAVAILDESGESALTFRALAQRLRGGVGSVYWYVSGRSELLDRAADRVLAHVVEDTAGFAGSDRDPIENVRGIALALFDAVAARPWLGAYAMRSSGTQRNGLALFERLGQQVMRLGLGPRRTFDGVSAVTGYVIGVAADLAQQPPEEVADGDITRDGYLRDVADTWRENDPAEFPFLHSILDVFVGHDDAEQFRAGLDLLLAGLRLQAASGPDSIRPPT